MGVCGATKTTQVKVKSRACRLATTNHTISTGTPNVQPIRADEP